MKQNMLIRRYRSSDHAEVVELNAYGLAAAGLTPEADVNAGDLDDVTTVYLTGRATLLVGELDGRVAAMGALRQVSATTCEITRMRVAPSAQGRGFGKRILGALEEEARRLGYTDVVLLTGPDQHPAIDLYRAANYTVAAIESHGGIVGVRLLKHML